MAPVLAGALRDSFVQQLHHDAQGQRHTTESCQSEPARVPVFCHPLCIFNTHPLGHLAEAGAAWLAGNLH